MLDSLKKYLPYAAVIFGVFLIVPIFFANDVLREYFPIALYVLFIGTTVVCSALFCSKHGLDFLFALIAPIAFLLTMFIFCGGFNLTNIILLVLYLVSGVFGLFLGDLLLGSERRKKEKNEKAEAEKRMMRAKRRDEREIERMEKEEISADSQSYDDDDFDYDKYLADIDKRVGVEEDEIDRIMNKDY